MSTVLTPILISSASALILGCAVHIFYFLGGVLVGGGASDVGVFLVLVLVLVVLWCSM